MTDSKRPQADGKFGRHVFISTEARSQPTLTRLMQNLGWMPGDEARAAEGVAEPSRPPDSLELPPVKKSR